MPTRWKGTITEPLDFQVRTREEVDSK
jgi:hypothetical protein